MKKLYTAIFVISLLTGCSVYQLDSKDSVTNFHPPKKDSSEIVYLETTDKPFEEIGTVTVTTERRQSTEEILQMIKLEAATLGADAIMDLQSDATGSWKAIKPIKLQKILSNAYIRANYSAKAIVFK